MSDLKKDLAIIVLTGASGVGKTTLIEQLSQLAIDGMECINCDRVQLEITPSGDGSDYQAAILKYWIDRLMADAKQIDIAVLDTQIRPHRAKKELQQMGINNVEIVLIDCDPTVRNERLRTERNQPELISAQMDCWAAYLRGQADAMELPIINTSQNSIENSLKLLMLSIEKLQNSINGTE